MVSARSLFVLVALLLPACARPEPEFKGDLAREHYAGPVLFGSPAVVGATNVKSGGQNALAVTVIILD